MIRHIGIVGHESAKFTAVTEPAARRLIRELIADPRCIVVSGHCPLGGVDIYAEEEAEHANRKMVTFAPERPSWEDGFKPRNLQIANYSDIVHCIVVQQLPDEYRGMRFVSCYHCDRFAGSVPAHVKSGGCWTAWKAPRRQWHIISPTGTVLSTPILFDARHKNRHSTEPGSR